MKNIFLFLICLAFSSTSILSHAQTNNQQRPTNWATPMTHKIGNLHQITPNLYRSEQPLAEDLNILKELNIKTIVNLRSRNKDKRELSQTDLNLVHIPIRTWAIKEQQIADALWAIEQGQKQGSVLLHCYHGSDRTGLVSAMYRIIYQDWSIEQAKQEMKQGGYGFHSIWINIEDFFTPEHVNNIKMLLKEKQT
ncbi:phosphatase domain-containing putative toxin [Neisseria sp. Ec49-e6-T10]|uniref:phosphatase domain-containing putative toxin n=1 Tax=Neisseria sp. Ec49-e6-T10 TaxID=3140744 RepID=UPI003EBB491E